MDEQNKEVQISIKDIFSALFKKWWIICLSTVLCAILVFFYVTCFVVQKYKATVKIYVNCSLSSMTKISISDLSANRDLVDTYAVILTSRQILEGIENTAATNEETGGLSKKYSYSELSKMVSIGSVNDTEVFYVSFTADNAKDAINLANASLINAEKEITDIIKGSSVSLVERAVSAVEVSKKRLTKTIIGCLVGFILSSGLIIVFDLFVDDTIKSVDWVKEYVGNNYPLLSVIPDTNHESSHRYQYYSQSKTDESNL